MLCRYVIGFIYMNIIHTYIYLYSRCHGRPQTAGGEEARLEAKKKPAAKREKLQRLHFTVCSEADFRSKAVSWVQNESVANQKFEVSCRRDRAAAGSMRVRLQCTSCAKCRQGKGLRGHAVYTNGTMSIYGKGAGSHGDFSHRYGDRASLTDGQKHAVLESLKTHDNTYKIQNLMQYLRGKKVAGGLPDESTVTDFINNSRNRKKACFFRVCGL